MIGRHDNVVAQEPALLAYARQVNNVFKLEYCFVFFDVLYNTINIVVGSFFFNRQNTKLLEIDRRNVTDIETHMQRHGAWEILIVGQNKNSYSLHFCFCFCSSLF